MRLGVKLILESNLQPIDSMLWVLLEIRCGAMDSIVWNRASLWPVTQENGCQWLNFRLLWILLLDLASR